MGKKSRGFYVVNTFILFSVFFFSVCAVSLNYLARFSEELNEFQIKIRDQDRLARKELEDLMLFYRQLSDWRLDYVADNFMFKNLYLYEAATAYLEEDRDRVEKILEGRRDDHLALHINAISKFRFLQAAYQNSEKKADKEKILSMVLENVSQDFCDAVRIGPGPEKAFDYSWNCDLSLDLNAARGALEKKPASQVILRIPKEEKGKPNKQNTKDPLKEKVDDKGNSPGKSEIKKKG